MNYREESLKKHAQWRGKIEVVPRVEVDSREKLSLAYTPGVAERARHNGRYGGFGAGRYRTRSGYARHGGEVRAL